MVGVVGLRATDFGPVRLTDALTVHSIVLDNLNIYEFVSSLVNRHEASVDTSYVAGNTFVCNLT